MVSTRTEKFEMALSDANAAVPPERVGTIVGLAYGLVALSSSAVAVVIPAIRDDLDLPLATAAWVITAFVVALAASAPIYGHLADRIGTRRPITIGLSLMAAGAALAAIAPTVEMLLASRAIQGAGAGAVPVLAPAIIAARTSPVERPRALTRMSALAAAAAAGLLLGAVLAEIGGWRPVVGLPLIGVSLAIPLRRLASTHPAPDHPMDVVGAAAVAALAIGINLVLQIRASPTTGVIGLTLAALGLVVARHRFATTMHPFIAVAVLRRTIGWRLGVAAAAIPAAYFALLIAIPSILTARHGQSELAIGALLVPAALAGAFVGPLDRRMRTAMSGVIVGAIGVTASAVALVVAATLAHLPIALVIAFALAAMSFGLGQSALLNEITTATPDEERGAALSLFMVTFFVGGGIGGATLGALTATMSTEAALGWLAIAPAAAALLAATTRTEP